MDLQDYAEGDAKVGGSARLSVLRTLAPGGVPFGTLPCRTRPAPVQYNQT